MSNSHISNSETVSIRSIIISLRNWVLHLWCRRWILLVVGLTGAVLGYYYAKSKKIVYSASTTFVLEEDKGSSNLGSLIGLASVAGADLTNGGGSIFQGDNILELYKSRKMIERALMTPINNEGRDELLVDKFIEFNELRESWKGDTILSRLNFKVNYNRVSMDSRARDSVIGKIVGEINQGYLKVSKIDKKLSIINVEVKSEDEYFSKVFNERIVATVNDFYIQTKTKKSLDNVAILQQKVDSVRAVMNGDIYRAVSASDATPNLNPSRQVQRLVPVQRSQFSAETNKAILGELVKNLEMSKMSLFKETPLIQVIDEPIFPLEKIRFGKLKWLLLGTFGALFSMIFVLTVFRFFKNIINEK